jgi:hypothetical protein
MGRDLSSVEAIAQVLDEENTCAAYAQQYLTW